MEFLLMTVFLQALCMHQGLEGGLLTLRLENCSGTLLALHHGSHLNCSGTEKNLWQCTGLQKDRNYCGHKEDAAVVCSGSSYTPFITIKTFTTDLTNWTTEIVTEAAAEDESGGISAPVLGCIVLSVTLFLLLFSNAVQCAYYKKQNGGIEIRRASQVSQQGNSHTSNNSNYERYYNPDSPTPATANNCEHTPAHDSGSTSSGECYENTETENLLNPVVSQFHPEYCIKMTPLNNTSEAAKKYSEDLFDSDSTSSGECYENTGPCLYTFEGDPSLPEQPSLSYPKPQMEGNSSVSQPYYPDQAPVAADSFDSESTSSEECYENIGTDAETCLQTLEEDISFPEQPPLSHTQPQMAENSSVFQTYTPDQDDSSTSSEEAYENVAEIEENCFAGSERTAHSSSDSDYDDVCNW
ncbi:uncharacterized protein LOC124384782 isoform X2 [Silurus meridionalis]|uniref:uncharacterized protein LOC124384782 isoform X2 n=1 Tax=Silurus meridionalis TaxID=175797 RepID=UPI001EEBFE59|nr:uncharacterized protein LOC124384782 isoform X2 [Silurus meridionalis]